MKFEISIKEAAKSELREAFLWYENQLMNLGDKFQEEVYSGFESIINPRQVSNPLRKRMGLFFGKISFWNSLYPIRKFDHNHRCLPYFKKPGKMAKIRIMKD